MTNLLFSRSGPRSLLRHIFNSVTKCGSGSSVEPPPGSHWPPLQTDGERDEGFKGFSDVVGSHNGSRRFSGVSVGGAGFDQRRSGWSACRCVSQPLPWQFVAPGHTGYRPVLFVMESNPLVVFGSTRHSSVGAFGHAGPWLLSQFCQSRICSVANNKSNNEKNSLSTFNGLEFGKK